MALTVSEAIAVNQVLGWFLKIGPPRYVAVDEERALEAARLLADHAHRRLAAGRTPSDVAGAWLRRPGP